jgi:hypothetical protein
VLRRAIFLLCALSSCAPATRDGWVAKVNARSEGLCWWRNARWEDRAPLRVRGSGEVFGRARARWAGELWRGSSTTAVLRRSGPVVVLQGEWTGPGLTLSADVDVTQSAVFRAYEPIRVGSAGLLLKGGHVRVSDAVTGQALVLPSEEAFSTFRPTEAVASSVGCDQLSLSAIPESDGDDGRRRLAASGFKNDAPEKWIAENVLLPASAKKGGPTIGLFTAERTALRGFVVDTHEDESRLVVPGPGGMVWVGWVPTAHLQTAPVQQDAAAKAASPNASTEAAPSGEWRACEREDLPVTVQLRTGELREIGTLQRGAAFSIVGRNGEHHEAKLGVEWLEVDPNVKLLLPSSASDCPRQKQLGAW